MSDSLNQLITVIDSLLAYSKNTHATAVKEVELKLSNNELLDLFAAKLAGINNPPFITAESFNKRMTLLDEGFNKSISIAIAEVQGSFNAKLDNLTKSLKEDVRKLSAELSENEPKLQAMQQKQEAALQSIKNDFANKLSATENKLQDLINNKSQASQLSIEALSESSKQLLKETRQNIQEQLTSEFSRDIESLKSNSNKKFAQLADLLINAKSPIRGLIFTEPLQQEIIKQLISNPSEIVKSASPQTDTQNTAPTSDNVDENEGSNAIVDLILNSLTGHKQKSDVQKDKAAQKIRSYCSVPNSRSSLNNMNIGEYYLNISKQQWKDIIDAAHKEIESK
jgi:hypothetical protein